MAAEKNISAIIIKDLETHSGESRIEGEEGESSN